MRLARPIIIMGKSMAVAHAGKVQRAVGRKGLPWATEVEAGRCSRALLPLSCSEAAPENPRAERHRVGGFP